MPINPQKLDAFRNYRPQSGAHALTDAEKTKPVDNNVSEISFFVDRGIGGARPLLTAKPSAIKDAGRLAKVLEATPERLGSLRGRPDEFAKFVNENVTARQAYFAPAFDAAQFQTRFKYNNIVGQRVKQFIDEAVGLADELYASDPAQKTAAYYAVNTAAFDLLAREIEFDDFEIDGYASFGHDAAFIHAWELRLGELNKVDLELCTPDQRASIEGEKSQIQGELDAIFRDKYVYHSGNMQETDAEETVGLCLIDRGSRQRVSEVEASRDSIVPRFEVLNVTVEGKDRPVYFDAGAQKYYFDKTDEEVPAALVGQITRRELSNDEAQGITFRRAVPGEHLRQSFRFDWNGDGYVQNTVIDWVGWGGHCNDKANLESHGVVVPRENQGVYEYSSLSGSTAHYDRKLLNEKLMSFSELASNPTNSEFAGARDDDRPDRVTLNSNTKLPWSEHPNEFGITKVVKDGKTYEAPQIFSEHIVAEDGKSASNNPLYKRTTEGDRIELSLGGAAIHASARYQVFDDASGYPSMVSKDVVLDFANPTDEPIVVDSVMQDAGKREMYEISIDTKKKEWVAQLVRMEKKPDGSGYEKKKVDDPIRRAIDPASLAASHETELDNPALYFEFIKEALTSGRNFTSETALDAGVWNGRTMRLKEAKVWRDDATKWAKVDLEVSARYGGGSGSFLVKLKDDGEPDFFVPESAAFDFAWRTDVVFDPFDRTSNETARSRGVVTSVGGRTQADAVSNMLEVLHCAFNARPYVIMHEGTRYYFDTKEQWEAEKAKLDQLRGDAHTV